MLGSRKYKKNEKKAKKWQNEFDKDVVIHDSFNQDFDDDKDSQSNNNISLKTDEKSKRINDINQTENNLEKSTNEDLMKNVNKKYDWMSSSDELDNNTSSLEEEIKENSQKLESKKEQSHEHYDKRTIFVNNLNYETNNYEIRKFFEQFGSILNIDIPKNEGSNFNKGRAFIEYSKINEAEQAFRANGTKLGGMKISIMQGLSQATSSLATAVIEKIKETETKRKKIKKSKRSMSRSSSSEHKRRRSRSNKQKKKK